MARQARRHAPVSVLMFDLDHFKSINDRFGHAIGDETLRLFGTTAAGNMRTHDVVARFGGEEFVAMLPGDVMDAAIVADRVRVAFEAAAVQVGGHSLKATVSIGAACGEATTDIDELIRNADAALYRAKTSGRNRVELASKADAIKAQVAALRAA
jgi:diguanylate cyclase (GGDEF)-like protein